MITPQQICLISGVVVGTAAVAIVAIVGLNFSTITEPFKGIGTFLY